MTNEEFHFKWRGGTIERKIGEVYEKEGKKIKCVEVKSKSTCINCVYHGKRCSKDDIDGECLKTLRSDKTYVKFVEVKMEKKYVFSYDGETYKDESHSTREEALEYATKHWNECMDPKDILNGDLTIYTAIANYYQDEIDPDDIIESLQDYAYDEGGEYSEGYLDNITVEQKDILKERLNKIWKEFKKEFKLEANFFNVNDVEEHYFNIWGIDNF